MRRFFCWLLMVIPLWRVGVLPCGAVGGEIQVEQPAGTVLTSGAGTVVAWGRNDFGQTTVPGGLTGVVAVAAGDSHSLALLEDGSVVGWGRNDFGQTTPPVPLGGVRGIAAGTNHSVALLADGTVYAWGRSFSGETNVPEDLTGVVAIAARTNHSLALKSDGTVVQWGDTADLVQMASPVPLRSVTTGQSHAAGMRQGVTGVSLWGLNTTGQITQPPVTSDLVDVEAGYFFNLALRNDTTLMGWGLNSSNAAVSPSGLTGVFSMACGSDHSVVVKQDGTVFTWGNNSYGQTTPPPGLTNARTVAAGLNHTVALVKTRSHVDMGASVVGTSGAIRTFTVKNTGTRNLNVRGVTVQGGQWPDFILTTSALPAVVAPGGSMAFSARFRPWAAGARSTVLRVESDDADERWFEVQLDGMSISNDAALRLMTASPAVLTPAFNPDIVSYSMNLAYTASTVQFTVSPRYAAAVMQSRFNGSAWNPLSGPGGVATLGPLSLNPGQNTVDMLVTAEDGITLKTYTVRVTRAFPSANATLSALSISSPAVLTPSFSPAVTAYSAEVSNAVESIRLIPYHAEGNGTMAVRVTGTGLDTGFAPTPNATLSVVLPLAQGLNVVTMRVTAQDGITVKDYVIHVMRRTVPEIGVTVTGAGDLGAGRVSITGWGVGSTFQELTVPAAAMGAVSVVIGTYHAAALQGDGTVVAWGNPASTAVPPGLQGVVSIVTGTEHTLALKADGTVAAFGKNADGQALVPAGLSGVVGLGAGEGHSLAVRSNGTVVAWGSNLYGERNVPEGLTGVVAAAGGSGFSLALKSNGRVAGWGRNHFGQVSVPADLTNVKAIAAGSAHCLALLQDGTVRSWGANVLGEGAVPAGLAGVKMIAAGDAYSAALRNDGSVVTWGSVSGLPAGLANVRVLACGAKHCLALGSPAATVEFGEAVQGTAGAVQTFLVKNTGNGALFISRVLLADAGAADFLLESPGGAAEVPVGGERAYAVRFQPLNAGARRAVLQIFSNDEDENPFEVELRGAGISTDARLVSLTTSAGPVFPAFSSAVTAYDVNAPADAETVTLTAFTAWPLAAVAVRAAGGAFVPVASGAASGPLTLAPGASIFEIRATAEDGVTSRLVTVTVHRSAPPQLVVEQAGTTLVCPPRSLLAQGTTGWSPANLPAEAGGIIELAAGGSHALALRSDGTVLAWGANAQGQASVPPGLAGVVAIAAGNTHSVALRSDGTVVAWGSNASNQTAVPAGLTEVTAIAAGDFHTVAVRRDGTVRAWGDGTWQQTIVPSAAKFAVRPAAGDRHSIVRVYGGGIMGWGSNTLGQLTIPAGTANVLSVTAGGNHSLGITAAGTVVAWGENADGQCTVPAGLKTVAAVAAGAKHSLALLDDGRVTGWGSNAVQQSSFPAGFNASLIAARSNYSLASGRVLTPVDFGRPVVETASAVERAFTLRNSGGAPLHIAGVTLAGADASFFTVNSQSMSNNVPGGGGETAFTVSYRATDQNAHSARLRIITDAGTEPFDLLLTGAGSSNNASLVSLTTSGPAMTPNFDPDITEYTVNASYAQTSISFLPKVAAVPATIQFRMNGGEWRPLPGDTSTGDQSLVTGTNAAEFKVTASDGVTERLYTVTVTRAAISTDTSLSALTLSTGSLTPAFEPGVNSYSSEAPNVWTAVTVTAVAANPFAAVSMRMNGGAWAPGPYPLDIGGNTLEVRVTAQDFSTRIYTVEIHRQPAPEISIEHPAGTPVRLAGTVVVWGDNSQGQRNVPAGLNGVVAIAAGSHHTVALRSDGTAVNWGQMSTVPAAVNTNLLMVTGGANQSLAVQGPGGALVAWGAAMPAIPAGLTGLLSVSASEGHRVAVRSNGTVYAWGGNAFGQTTVPAGLSDVTGVAAGGEHSIAVRRDGSVVVWGSSQNGQQTLPFGLNSVTAVAAGDYWCLALKSDGTTLTWGNITPPGVFTHVAAISACARNGLMLKRDGSIASFGDNSFGQRNVPAGLKNVRAVAAGVRHSAALVADPTVDFGPAPRGGAPVSKTFTVRNTGTGALHIAGVSFTEGDTGDFSVSGVWPETVAAGATAEFTVAFSPAATSPRDAYMRVSSDDADESAYELRFTGTGMLPWDYWKQANFGSEPNGTGPAADFDSDGVINLLEFACGTDPRANSPGALHYSGTLAGGGSILATGQPAVIAEGNEVRALYVRRKDRVSAGLTYTPQFAAGENAWQDSAVAGVVLAEDAMVEIVSLPFPTGTGLFRLKVRLGP